MTPADILRIARAVFPDAHDPCGYWIVEADGLAEFRTRLSFSTGETAENVLFSFNPLNSNDDAFRVLVWLLAQNLAVIVGARTIGGYFPGSTHQWCVKHDGTEAGLRRAITEAAGRVTL